MRKTFFSLIALGTATFITAPAMAEKWVKLHGTYSRAQIEEKCKSAGGNYSGTGENYSCHKPGGGGVSCDSGGTCWGCGTAGKPGGGCDAAGTTGRGTIGGILTNAPATKKQPLTPQKVTRSPTTAPAQPLRPQKATRSPATAPTHPLTPQKVTRSPATAPTQPLTSSPSFRRGGQ
jgi:hypothetical protein